MSSPESIKRELESPDYLEQLHRHELMWRSLAMYFSFCKMNFSRAGDIGRRNFFLRVMDDFLQSIVAINFLCKSIRKSSRSQSLI